MGAGGQESVQKEIQIFMFKTQIAQDLNVSICGPTSPHGNDLEDLSITYTPFHLNFHREGPTHRFLTHQDMTKPPGHGAGLGGKARL